MFAVAAILDKLFSKRCLSCGARMTNVTNTEINAAVHVIETGKYRKSQGTQVKASILPKSNLQVALDEGMLATNGIDSVKLQDIASFHN